MTSASLATNCKPVLGYSSKGAACIALKAQGLTWTEIGKRLNMPAKACSSLACRTRRRERRSVRLVKLGANIFFDLEREAVKRGVSVDVFAQRLLTSIVTDGLYNAILDDEGNEHG